MPEVLVGYASVDRDIAERVAHALEAQTLSVWWGQEPAPGQQFAEGPEQELSLVRCVVVLWSHASTASDGVNEEAREAQRRGVLVPAIIQLGVQPPASFRGLQTADLSGWVAGGSDAEFLAFSAAIRSMVGRPPARPAPPAPSVHAGRQAESRLRTESGWSPGKKIIVGAAVCVALGAVAVVGQAMRERPEAAPVTTSEPTSAPTPASTLAATSPTAPAPTSTPSPPSTPTAQPTRAPVSAPITGGWRDADLGYYGRINWNGGPQAFATVEVFDLGDKQAPLGRREITLSAALENPQRALLQGSVQTSGHLNDRQPHPHSINLVVERPAAGAPWIVVRNCASKGGRCW